jgi:translation initiation factor IF-1
MPGVTARSAAKNMSRGARAKASKNNRRVEAAVNDELDYCTYGKITKALGNKMFLAMNTDKTEHLCHIRGKMTRVEVGCVVLLNIRDYETRSKHGGNVYDIMAVFPSKDVSRLIKAELVPSWMNGADTEGDDLHDLFDYEAASDDDEDGHNKKDKKNHSKASKHAGVVESDSDVDIDRI